MLTPRLSPKLAGVTQRLEVAATFFMTEEEYRGILASAGLEGDNIHLTMSESGDAEYGGGALAGLLGIHRETVAPETPDPSRTPFWFHYKFTWTPRPRIAAKDALWDSAFAAVAPLVPQHPARALLDAEYAANRFDFPVSVPISLAAEDAPGFSQIRGVRLVQVDPAKPTSELYSVVLDRDTEFDHVLIRAHVSTAFDDNILCSAAEQIEAIANLALKEKGERT